MTMDETLRVLIGSPLAGLPVLRNCTSRRASSWDRSGGNDDRLHIQPGEQAVDEVRAQVGTERVILGLSGGVDSSVAAALLHRAIGELPGQCGCTRPAGLAERKYR